MNDPSGADSQDPFWFCGSFRYVLHPNDHASKGTYFEKVVLGGVVLKSTSQFDLGLQDYVSGFLRCSSLTECRSVLVLKRWQAFIAFATQRMEPSRVIAPCCQCPLCLVPKIVGIWMDEGKG